MANRSYYAAADDSRDEEKQRERFFEIAKDKLGYTDSVAREATERAVDAYRNGSGESW